MKTIVFSSVFIMLVLISNGQVTLNQKYDYSTSVVKLETLGYKYYLMDVPNGQCRIYNTDHSLFKTINCNVPSGFYLCDIKYLSESIFDNDSEIELICTFYKYNSSLNYYEYDSKIINEDGSQIQLIEGSLYNYINKTGENQYKVFSYCFDFSTIPEKVSTNIYSLTAKPIYSEEHISICEGSDYLGWTEPGDYTRILVSISGADSIVTTHLTLNPLLESFEQISICSGENYKTWTETGNYSQTVTTSSGCDSTIYTELIVREIVYNKEQISICEGSDYLGWTEPGSYQRTLVSANGCDSTVITNLIFYPSIQAEIIIRGDTLLSPLGFQSYQWFDKNSELPNSNNPEFIIPASGEYYLQTVDTNGCISISAPVNVLFSLIEGDASNPFKCSIVPNPNNGQFSFRIDSNPPEEIQLKLLNNLGNLIETRLIEEAQVNHNENFDISHYGKGMYYLRIESNKIIKTEKVIIQ